MDQAGGQRTLGQVEAQHKHPGQIQRRGPLHQQRHRAGGDDAAQHGLFHGHPAQAQQKHHCHRQQQHRPETEALAQGGGGVRNRALHGVGQREGQIAQAGQRQRRQAAAQGAAAVGVVVRSGQGGEQQKRGGHGGAPVAHVNAAENGPGGDGRIDAAAPGDGHQHHAHGVGGAEGRADEKADGRTQQKGAQNEQPGLNELHAQAHQIGNGAAEHPAGGEHADDQQRQNDHQRLFYPHHQHGPQLAGTVAVPQGVNAEQRQAEAGGEKQLSTRPDGEQQGRKHQNDANDQVHKTRAPFPFAAWAFRLCRRPA